MEVRIIKGISKVDIKNEPFKLFGRLIPRFDGKNWHYKEELWRQSEIREMCFPQENYNPQASKSTFVGAFDGDKCVGLAVLTHHMFKFMYLEDLKVNALYRGRGIASELISKCMELALAKGYRGLYTIGQDNNLAACRLYLKNGFEIGGFNNTVYEGTEQEGKADIVFYLQEKVEFRMANSDDAAVLVDIYNDAFLEDYKRYGVCPGYGRTVEQMAVSIKENPKHIVFLGQKPVGVIAYRHEGRGNYHIGCIAIKSDYQRMGLGSQAFRHMLSLCRDWERITLETPSDKQQNISFYTKMGFETNGQIIDAGVKLTKFVMEKKNNVLRDDNYQEELQEKEIQKQAVKEAISEIDSIIAELENADIELDIEEAVAEETKVKLTKEGEEEISLNQEEIGIAVEEEAPKPKANDWEGTGFQRF